ncbi:MAG TPA: hypothetical protein VKT99_10495 [Xanthobacteraceae bacterium]|jgi:hypothetical protein|nr:hypothetical protein [Xanthobacteraceae bacterium]
MTKQELDNLVKIGQLKSEPGTQAEFDGMVDSAKKRLADARNESLASESQFDLAYGAAHGFALAALRQKGYRSENRYTVFQALAHTVEGLDPAAIRIFAKAHNERNLAEYEGRTEVDEGLLKDLIRCTTELQKAVLALSPPTQ